MSLTVEDAFAHPIPSKIYNPQYQIIVLVNRRSFGGANTLIGQCGHCQGREGSDINQELNPKDPGVKTPQQLR